MICDIIINNHWYFIYFGTSLWRWLNQIVKGNQIKDIEYCTEMLTRVCLYILQFIVQDATFLPIQYISGAFLIPYFIMVFCGALPILLLEIGLGQYMSRGGLKSWIICPLFQGSSFCWTTCVFYCDCLCLWKYKIIIIILIHSRGNVFSSNCAKAPMS